MRVIRLGTSDDARIAEYRDMSDAELLRRRGLFVAEGRLVVARLLEARHRVTSLLLNAPAFEALKARLEGLPDDTPVYLCDTPDFESITGYNLHKGCLALAVRPEGLEPREIAERSRLVIVLEGVSDADNIGSVFRNAAAFGADGILLSPTCCDPLYRKSIRTSMGSVLKVPHARLSNWPDDLDMLKTAGFTVVALTPNAPAVDLRASGITLQSGRRVVLLVGTEGGGLSSDAARAADLRVRIPICAGVDSLNLATATGIALHALVIP